MRSTHTKFNELINNTEVTWDSTTGLVSVDEALWDAFFKVCIFFYSILLVHLFVLKLEIN